MKRFKRWFLAFLVGEFFTLFKKDKQFKQWVIEKTGLEKIQHIVEWLLNFNKELVEDAKEHFDTEALETHLQQWVSRVEHEYAELVEQLEPLKVKWGTITHEFLAQLQQRFETFSHTALLVKEKISSFDVEEKIQEMKKIFENLAKQIKKQ
jgi:hypothetical protein